MAAQVLELQEFSEESFERLWTVKPWKIDGIACFEVTKSVCFEDMPREIRDQIWEYALPEARIVKADIVNNLWQQTYDYDHHIETPQDFWDVPNFLHICTESRELAVKHYQPLLHDKDGHPGFYIDPYHDVLSMGTNLCKYPCYHPSYLKNAINGSIVRKLAIGQLTLKCEMLFDGRGGPGPRRLGDQFLADFRHIRRLFFCLPDQWDENKTDQEAGVAGWKTWKFAEGHEKRLGDALAMAFPDLLDAFNMTADYEVLNDCLAFQQNSMGMNEFLLRLRVSIFRFLLPP